MQISAVIITLNEESNIAEAIASVDFADEIVVVDAESKDRTVEIARSLGARVIVNPWPGFSAQKQFATDSATNDWVLSLDADERVSAELKTELLDLMAAGPAVDGFRIPRLSFYLGKPIRHGGWYPDRQLRLFNRRKGRWNGRTIHESFETSDAGIVGRVNGEIQHYTVNSLREHAEMIAVRYAPLAADQMLAEGRRTSVFKAAISGAATFIRSYFFRLGFLDGFAGYCIAFFAAFHNTLKHLLLLEKQRSASEAADSGTTTKR